MIFFYCYKQKLYGLCCKAITKDDCLTAIKKLRPHQDTDKIKSIFKMYKDAWEEIL